MAHLVDTHALLWFVFDDPRLSENAARLLEKETLLFSVASLWEIAVKVTIEKLRLGMSYPDFVHRYIASRDIEVLPIESAHLIEYVSLPRHHRDPFDRLLVAQARTERLPVVTADPRFRPYGVEAVW